MKIDTGRKPAPHCRPRGNVALRALLVAAFAAGAGHGVLAQTAPADAPAPAPAADAAPVDLGTLQEIVITATRHQEVMSKVPVSVSAFSQETLDLKGVKDFSDIAKYTPGVNIDANGSNNISIRGISSSGGSGTTGIYIDDTPIQMRALGFNADDTLPKTFDLERVEVLRGPQGTLFGSGSEGGTVRYILAQPNMHEASVYARSELAFTQGGAPSYEAGIAGGAPIVDGTLGVRASIWYRHDGGWIDQINPFTLGTVQKNSNFGDDVVMRVAAKWAVNDLLTITPSILYQDRNTNNVTAYWPIYSNPDSNSYKNADPDRRAEPDHYYLPSLKIETEVMGASLISNTSYFSRKDLSGYNGTEYNLSYYQTFNWLTPSNIFQSQGYYPLIDGNGLHLPAALQGYRAPATVTNQQDDFTQEIRLQSNDQDNSRFTWTTGLFFSSNRQTSVEEINDPQMYTLFSGLFSGPAAVASSAAENPPYTCNYTPGANAAVLQEEQVYCANGATVLEPLLANGDSYYNYNFSRDKQIAIFGETSIKITDKLKGIVGLRYAKTDVSFTHFADGPQNFIGPNAGTGTQSDKPFTPKLGLSYQADPSDLYYATYAKGYRIGGADPPIPSSACASDLASFGIAAAPNSYNSDTVQSFELGTKNNFQDRFRVASSLYYIKWKNIQQNIYLPGCGFQFTANVGQAVAKGGDLQIEWAPNEAIDVEAAIGYTDARFSADAALSPSAAQPVVASGDAVTGESGVPVSPWTLTVGGQYNFTAMDHKSFVRLDWELQTHNNTPTPAEDPATSQYAYGYAYTPASTSFFTLRVGTTVDKRWNVSGFIDNLFDVHPTFPPSSYPYSDVDKYNPIFVNTGVPGTTPLIRAYTYRPRTFGLTTTYRF
jgi:outer membrane receptor protein involved in Fe transport